ncbi:MAG: phosphotransferase [Polyangiaceae bacterium]
MNDDADSAADAPEIPLGGGRLTQGVVRIGNTVRRPARPSSDFVAALLRHLEGRAVSWAPRYLGRDEQGRDSFSFLPGSVPLRWGSFSDDQVRAAGALLRAFHDATRDTVLSGAGKVVCHHDFGPNNAVFVDDLPVALIDFDFAAPGSPLEDVGYSAWAWCISYKPTRPPVQTQAHQVRLIADAYGLDTPARALLVDAILERLQRNERLWTSYLHDPQGIRTPPEKIPEFIDWSRREHAFVSAERSLFEAALR